MSDSREERIERLLDRWEASRDAGEPLSAEKLATGDDFELLGILRQRIAELESFDRFARTNSPPDQTQVIQLGRYRLIEPIARGATSVVYRAVRTDAFAQFGDNSSAATHESFAVKVLNPERIEGAGAARFRREVAILRKLDHPQIARIVDYGIGRLGLHDQPYLVMPLIEGEPLDRHVFTRNLPVRSRVTLLVSVAKAIQSAHEKGVIHRDLKPANILVTADGVPMIVDFGLAKRTTHSTELDSFQTTAAFIGTLPFMSPEQTAGSHDDVDERSDVYSLGVIAYQLFAGELPIPTHDCSILDAHLRIRNSIPKSLSNVNREIPNSLARIVSKSLAKERYDRYANVANFTDDLQRFLAGQPVLAKKLSIFSTLMRWCQRHPWFAFGSAIVVGSLLMATGVSLKSARDSRAAQLQTQAALDRETKQKNAAIEHENRFRKLHYQVIQGLVNSQPLLASEQLDDESLFPESDRLVAWHVLRNRCDHLAKSWPADEVAFAEGGQFAVRCFGTEYTTHDMNSGEDIGRFEIGDDDVRILALSSDARWLALGDLDNHVDIRDGMTGDRITYLQSHGQNSHPTASFSRDNLRLATAGGDRFVRIWDTNTWTLIAERRVEIGRNHPGVIRWFPDGSKLAMITTGGRGYILDAERKKIIRIQSIATGGSITFSPQRKLLTQVNEVAIGEFDTDTGERIDMVYRDHRMPCVFDLSSTGNQLVIASEYSVCLKNSETGRTLLDVPGPEHKPLAVAMSANERQIYCHTEDHCLHQYSYDSPTDLHLLMAPHPAAEGNAICSQGKHAARWIKPNQIELFQNGQRLHSLEFPSDVIPVFALSQDGKLFAVASANDTIEVIDTKLAQLVFELSSPHPIAEIISIDKGWIVKCDNGLIYQLSNDQRQFVPLSSEIWDTNVLLASSANGQVFATAGRRRSPQVHFSLGGKNTITHIPTSLIRQSALALSADGSLLAVGKAKGEIEIFEARSGRKQTVCRGLHLDAIRMTFSPDQRLLATAHRDRTLAIWDVPSGLEQCRTFLPSTATTITFSKDATQLFIALQDGSVVMLGKRAKAETLSNASQ